MVAYSIEMCIFAKIVDSMRQIVLTAVLMGLTLTGCTGNSNKTDKDMNSALELTQEWDKVFPQSDKVDHKKVTFRNLYGIELAADIYTPKNANGKLAAIAVSGPFGAVKEQVSGLYAQHMAERGFLTIAFDPSYTGETAFEKMTGKTVEIPTQQEPGKNFSFVEGNKELYIVQGAVHTDLYDDRAGVIPYNKMEAFFKENLK